MGTPVLLSGHLCGKLSHSPRVELSLGFIVPIATFSAPQISDSSSGELPLLCAECGPQRVFSYSCFTLPFSGLHPSVQRPCFSWLLPLPRWYGTVALYSVQSSGWGRRITHFSYSDLSLRQPCVCVSGAFSVFLSYLPVISGATSIFCL